MLRVGVDAGGTFTDLVAVDEASGEIYLAKALSTPKAPSNAMFDALKLGGIKPDEVSRLIHGTTVATNALIERKGADVMLLTTDGFRDLLHMGRTTRPNHFDMHWVKPTALVPRSRVRGIPERILHDGGVLTALDETRVREVAREARELGVGAIAVCYLFSYMNPAHERLTRDIILEEWPDALISLSSDVLPRWREYERTSTTAIDAYLKPKIKAYMKQLESDCDAQGVNQLVVLRSNGGVMSARRAGDQPVSLVRSGPSGGITATAALGKLLGLGDVIAADMGGTSFEACLLPNSEPTFTNSEELEWGVPIAMTMVDARSIGAGGGSIAKIDAAGMMRVGPESAGADPGPICYGRGGTQVTVTDANVVLGRMPAAFPLGGKFELDREAARTAIEKMAADLGRTPEAVAAGIVTVASHNMAQALRLVSTDRGYDPRDATIVAYGGAGPLHACELARALQIRKVVVPRYPGAFSAFGALLGDARFDYAQTRRMRLRGVDVAAATQVFAGLEAQAAQEFLDEGFTEAPRLSRSLDLRYEGQNWELSVDVPEGPLSAETFEAVAKTFAEEHDRFYGYVMPGEELEILNFKLSATGAGEQVGLAKLVASEKHTAAPIGEAEMVLDDPEQPRMVPLYHRDTLPPGWECEGPAVIGQLDATTLLPVGGKVRVDEYGNLHITV